VAETVSHRKLTHDGALAALRGAIEKAAEMAVPQCIAVVDEGGNLMAFVRMSGAKFLSIQTAQHKAITAADRRVPTGGIDPGHELKLSLVTGGRLTNLKGGLPIVIEGDVVGGIGVSSGTGDEDLEVAAAGVAAIPGAKTAW
jgi:uncharacterized protein GlcG (DUF336 family)